MMSGEEDPNRLNFGIVKIGEAYVAIEHRLFQSVEDGGV